MYKKFNLHSIKYKYLILYAILTPIISISLIMIVRKFPFFGQLYATYIFPIFPNTIGRIFSILPFSVLEICIYVLIFLLIFVILAFIYNLFTKNNRRKLILKVPKIIVLGLCFCSTILLMVTLTCSINYSRDGIAKDINIIVAPSSHEQLTKLCLLLIDDINEITNVSSFSNELDESTLQSQTKQAMKSLGKKYPSLKGYYPNPKPVIMSSWMSNLNMTGLFSPYTIEANYNNAVVNYIKPFTICHEFAHLRGYIREDEAGFIAYLACSNSNSLELRYSGSLNALSYTLCALYKDSTTEEYQNILKKLPEKALSDLIENQKYWQAYQGTVSKLSSTANNTYLKANAQADGIKSYGKIVDLLLAYHGLNSQAV